MTHDPLLPAVYFTDGISDVPAVLRACIDFRGSVPTVHAGHLEGCVPLHARAGALGRYRMWRQMNDALRAARAGGRRFPLVRLHVDFGDDFTTKHAAEVETVQGAAVLEPFGCAVERITSGRYLPLQRVQIAGHDVSQTLATAIQTDGAAMVDALVDAGWFFTDDEDVGIQELLRLVVMFRDGEFTPQGADRISDACDIRGRQLEGAAA